MADGRRQGFSRRFRGDRTNGIILKESPIQYFKKMVSTAQLFLAA
jgi:hypothetical protein